jgi:hypothetical protein
VRGVSVLIECTDADWLTGTTIFHDEHWNQSRPYRSGEKEARTMEMEEGKQGKEH